MLSVYGGMKNERKIRIWILSQQAVGMSHFAQET